MTKRLILLAVLGAAVALLVPSPVMSASDTSCTGFLTGAHDNVVVPEGASCTISGAQIKGNIKSLPGSTLFVSGGTTVGGSIEADKPASTQIFNVGNVVHGNIQLKEGGSGIGVAVCGVTLPDGNILIEKINGNILVGGARCATQFGAGNVVVKGNIKVQENFITGGFGLQIGGNDVAQNIQVFDNKGPGPKTVTGNTAGESIQCFGNEMPFVGGPNTAPKKEGQCT